MKITYLKKILTGYSNSPCVRYFFNNLHDDSWTMIARFMDCDERIVSYITDNCHAAEFKVQMFLRWWRMPDCGNRINESLLQELRTRCGIDFASSVAGKHCKDQCA